MFSQACVILFTIGLMATWSPFQPCYGTVGTHPTLMFSCGKIKNVTLCYYVHLNVNYFVNNLIF